MLDQSHMICKHIAFNQVCVFWEWSCFYMLFIILFLAPVTSDVYSDEYDFVPVNDVYHFVLVDLSLLSVCIIMSAIDIYLFYILVRYQSIYICLTCYFKSVLKEWKKLSSLCFRVSAVVYFWQSICFRF